MSTPNLIVLATFTWPLLVQYSTEAAMVFPGLLVLTSSNCDCLFGHQFAPHKDQELNWEFWTMILVQSLYIISHCMEVLVSSCKVLSVHSVQTSNSSFPKNHIGLSLCTLVAAPNMVSCVRVGQRDGRLSLFYIFIC